MLQTGYLMVREEDRVGGWGYISFIFNLLSKRNDKIAEYRYPITRRLCKLNVCIVNNHKPNRKYRK